MFVAGFGESTFDLEIRAFVDSFDKRQRVRPEIHVAVERASFALFTACTLP